MTFPRAWVRNTIVSRAWRSEPVSRAEQLQDALALAARDVERARTALRWAREDVQEGDGTAETVEGCRITLGAALTAWEAAYDRFRKLPDRERASVALREPII